MKEIPVDTCTEQNSLINGPTSRPSASLHSVRGGGGGGDANNIVTHRRLARTHAKDIGSIK